MKGLRVEIDNGETEVKVIGQVLDEVDGVGFPAACWPVHNEHGGRGKRRTERPEVLAEKLSAEKVALRQRRGLE